jgi:restriction system protein
MAVWLVRAGRRGEREDLALQQRLALIGFDELPDLTDVDSVESVQDLLRQAHPDDSPNRLATWARQVWAFVGRIKEGDLIALPLKKQSAIAFGKVIGPYRYREDLPDGAHHTRPVNWVRDDLPRSAVDQDLLYSLGAFLTVCQIKRNNAEERIHALLEGRPAPLAPVVPPGEVTDEEAEKVIDVESYARDQLRAFIGQRFMGHDLARLVDGLLHSQGYRTERSAPGPDGGVDIMAGRGPMGFEPPRLLIQVKSSHSPVDVRVLRELQGVMGTFKAEQGLLVAWGGFKRSVYDEARTQFFSIRLWDSDDLIDAIVDRYDDLPDDLRAELPLKRVWVLVPGEG